MEKFKKLSRDEMKTVSGGGGGCGWCVTSGGCTYATQGLVPCPEFGQYESSSCGVCTCEGQTYYPCTAF
jgi:hypothetical protein